MTLKKQVLVVEDNTLNREMLTEILSEQYTVLQAENGSDAFEILQKKKDISLVLLDINMPIMDGYTFLDKVKADEELSLIPVIVTTQSGSEADEIVALNHGATDFVPKPYRPQVILHRMANLIQLRETAAMVNQYQYDQLTGLYSKEFFYQKVKELLLENPEQEYSIVCSNIENFKLYNDTFGVRTGDRLLKEVAKVVQDMIGEDGLCGRFGADRFLCLQKRDQVLKNPQNLQRAKRRKASSLMKNIVLRWGIYEIIDRSTPVEHMCDRALLVADSIKGKYDQHHAVYNDTMRRKLLREKAITDAMETALAEEQFSVYLQPKYSLKEECMVGAEALVRWNHPEWGIISPGEFIPLFEKSGFIFQLDQYIWEHVCRLLHDWKVKGDPLIPISVNVSRADVIQPNLMDILVKLTKRYEVDPSYLHLEITESTYADTPDQIISMVGRLRKHGFIIELDDFGSGYSSLNILSHMKLDILKLDMMFIRNEADKPKQQSILSDVINMAHRMSLSVVAEGVETMEQVEYLRSMGCDYVQGYFFAKPMPVAEFETLWKAQCRRPASPAPQIEISLHRILVVDEDAAYRKKVCQNFEGQYQVIETDDAYYALTCIQSEEQSSISAMILSMTLPDDGASMLLKEMRQNPQHWKIPILATIPNGERVIELPMVRETDDFLCKCHPLFDLSRRVQRLIDIAAAHKREAALQNEANQDHLTGLLNRRGLQLAMDSLRQEDFPIAVCLFDLDDLKIINDTYGHNTGDRMLRAFADFLRKQTRVGDVLCRYGGDEFMVILKHLHDADTAIKRGIDICGKFNEDYAKEQPYASCSGGIALCEIDEKLSESLIERADQALYRAKRENKGSCCLWEG